MIAKEIRAIQLRYFMIGHEQKIFKNTTTSEN